MSSAHTQEKSENTLLTRAIVAVILVAMLVFIAELSTAKSQQGVATIEDVHVENKGSYSVRRVLDLNMVNVSSWVMNDATVDINVYKKVSAGDKVKVTYLKGGVFGFIFIKKVTAIE